MRKIFSILLAGLITASLGACGEEGASNKPQKETVTPENALIYEGETDYKIVLSDEPTSNDVYAVNELNTLFSEATGVRFETVVDSEVTYDSNAKYISIGANDYLKQAGIKLDEESLYRSGYVLKTKGNSYFLSGSSLTLSKGSLYAVYDFLNEFLNYEYFAPECYSLTKNVFSLTNKSFDKTEIPDFAQRALMFFSVQSNEEYRNRMRLQQYNSTDIWVIEGHSTMNMANTKLPKGAYMEGIEFTDVTPETSDFESTEVGLSAQSVNMSVYEAYTLALANYEGDVEWVSSNEEIATVENGVVKTLWTGNVTVTAKTENGEYDCNIDVNNESWFTADGAAVCWTSEGLRKHYVRVIKSKIDEKPNGIYVQLGQADNNSVCNCENCLEQREKYMNFSGVQMVTLNKISDMITPWIKENHPNREIWIHGTAYTYSEEAPCVWDEEKGKYVAYHEDIIPRENVTIEWAPIQMDYAYSIEDTSVTVNAFSKKAIDAWTDLIGEQKIPMWGYCVNFRNYFLNYPNFSALAENYRYFHEKGIRYFIDQGPVTTGTATFEELRIYVQSKLMWDTSLNVNDLIDHFMENYYGVAADEINAYFKEINTYYAGLLENTTFSGLIYELIGSTEFWPVGLINNYVAKLENSIETVRAAKTLTETQKQAYIDRIKRLNLTNQYLYLCHYQGNFTENELREMLEEFEWYCNKYNIRDVSEGGSLSAQLNAWKK